MAKVTRLSSLFRPGEQGWTCNYITTSRIQPKSRVPLQSHEAVLLPHLAGHLPARLDRTIAYHDVVDFFYLERFMGLVAIMRPGSLLCLQPLATFLKQAGRLHCSGKPNSAWKSSTMGP